MTKAPEFVTEQEEWIGSSPLTLDSLKGKVVLIKFWTFMCTWCQEDLPKIMALGEKYKDQGLVLVGIHTPENDCERDISALKKQMEVLGVNFPVLTDNQGKNWKAYGVKNWPAYYLIDRDGNIVFDALGPGVEAKLEEQIKKILK